MTASVVGCLQPIPYLSFDGNCAEAMRFYEKVLGGKITVMMTGAESPICDQMPKEFADRIMNAQMQLPGGALLYGGDCPGHMKYEGIKGVSITLNYDSVDTAEQIFNALAEGGMVTMPYSPTSGPRSSACWLIGSASVGSSTVNSPNAAKAERERA